MPATSDLPPSPPSPTPSSPVTVGERGVVSASDIHQSSIVTGNHNVVTVHYHGVEIAIPSPDAIARHRIILREQLEKDTRARWGGMPIYIQEEGTILPIEASPYQAGQLGPRQNLLESLQAADRLLVLGEPGSGKTVALERLAWELCGSAEPTVPVVIRLFQYDGKPLVDWVRARLQEHGYLRLDNKQTLNVFLQEGMTRCVFLFDGLNEVPPGHRNTLVGELVRWMGNYARHVVIVTSRSQDELWRQLRGEIRQAIVVQPIHDEQARAYLEAHLAQKGTELYARLDERLRALARTPLVLWLIKEAGIASETLPRNRGELYERFISQMLRRDTERQMDAAIPEWIKRSTLADLALHMSRELQLYCSREKVMEIAAQKLGTAQAEAVIGACIRHGLLVGEERLWFAPHQTVREHFAAQALVELVEQEQRLGQVKRLWRSLGWLFTKKTGLAALAADDRWMETFVQLAGLVDNADWLAREVARTNVWLAWWCVEEGGTVNNGTRTTIEEGSIRLLQSQQVTKRRRAVQTLAKMQSERIVEILFQAATDSDPEVMGMATRSLLHMGEVVKERAFNLACRPEATLHQAGLAYLSTLVGQPMAWVPPGPFLMGSDKRKDALAYDDELPQHEITLHGFWISRYPVTITQFRKFIKESRYKPDERSLNGIDDHPVRYISWHDAIAYCHWLSEKTGLPVSLPSETEWEKAARGPATDSGSGRIYPWGNEFEKNKCNVSESGIEMTTPVGRYSPTGDSPYGCADMAGNVWEWTSSKYQPYPYRAEDGREDPGGSDVRVVRGGSWYYSRTDARAASRDRNVPDNRNEYYGFRVVVRPSFHIKQG